jgi:hypothetical protein
MPNSAAYFGFSRYQGGAGGAPTFSQSTRRIAAGNTTPIYTGDPVMPAVSTANGYITQGVAGTTRLDGIFVGCKYFNAAFGRTIWSPFWPGSGATGDVEAYVIDDPASRFLVQTSFANAPMTGTNAPTTMTSGIIGQYAQFAIGTGNISTGRSGANLSAVGTTITFPFIVVDYQISGNNGGDPASQFCNVIVGFNNEIFRSNGAGPTGIS